MVTCNYMHGCLNSCMVVLACLMLTYETSGELFVLPTCAPKELYLGTLWDLAPPVLSYRHPERLEAQLAACVSPRPLLYDNLAVEMCNLLLVVTNNPAR